MRAFDRLNIEPGVAAIFREVMDYTHLTVKSLLEECGFTVREYVGSSRELENVIVIRRTDTPNHNKSSYMYLFWEDIGECDVEKTIRSFCEAALNIQEPQDKHIRFIPDGVEHIFDRMQDYEMLDIADFQECDVPNVRPLSDEVLEVFGADFPHIDLFQTARAIIGIPREFISEVIHKGNPMRLFGAHFSNGKNIPSAFDESLEHIRIDKEDIIDCVVGIFIGKGFEISISDFEPFIKHLETALPEHIDPIWGFYIMEDKDADFAQVITLATIKRINEPLHDADLPF